MTIAQLIEAIESFAPPALAEPWDNVGLLMGSPTRELSGPVLLTIDLTEAVAAEAVDRACSAVVAYHPPIFSPVKRIIAGPGSTASQRVALRLIERGVAVYSPHTALDATAGGLTDWLSDGLLEPEHAQHPEATRRAADGGVITGGADRRALKPAGTGSAGGDVKLVTFVPAEALERVRGALASAGAGIIGEYDLCGFSVVGTGTFRPGPRAKPTSGKVGELNHVAEVRLEMVCARRAAALAIQTLRQLHPYEEPAIDVIPLEPLARRDVGVGRRITLDHPVTLAELAQRLKRYLNVPAVQVGGDAGRRVERIGVVPGAGASVWEDARSEGCEVFVTGEMKHHEVMALLASGMSVLLGGHTATERGYLPRFAEVLAARLPGAEFVVSEADRDPTRLM